MKLKIIGLFVCLLVLLVIVGCGTANTHIKVNAEEADLAYAKSTIALGIIKCIHAEQQNGDSGTIIGGRSEKESLEVGHAVRELITDFRKNPAAIWPSKENPKRTARTYLAEEGESLQKFCWPWLAREIRTVLTYG
jgi:hypothetical protein